MALYHINRLPCWNEHFIELEFARVPSTEEMWSNSCVVCTYLFAVLCMKRCETNEKILSEQNHTLHLYLCVTHKMERISGNCAVMLINTSFEQPFTTNFIAHCKTHANTRTHIHTSNTNIRKAAWIMCLTLLRIILYGTINI